MKITNSTLEQIQREGGFVQVFSDYTKDVFSEARLFPRISTARLIDAYGAWQNDLTRVGVHEPKLDDGLDHFKQAGHMAFWIRRASPVVESADTTQNMGDAPGYPISPDEANFRDLLFGYCNEYLAFDFGYQFCLFYEGVKGGPSGRANNLTLSDDYYRTMCHFLKFKTVSPHAMFLIYKSLFFE